MNYKQLEIKFSELTAELKELDSDSLAYKIVWDERVEIRRKMLEIGEHKCGGELCIVCGYKEKITPSLSS